MRITTALLAVFAAASNLTLGGCSVLSPSKPEEPPVITFDLKLRAAADVNPDDRGRAAPITVRVYELKTDSVFKSADFFSLQANDKVILISDLIQRDEFQLRPGEEQTVVKKPDPATKLFGVIAAYRDLPNSVWRTTYTLPPVQEKAWYQLSTSEQKVKMNIELEAKSVKFTEEKK